MTRNRNSRRADVGLSLDFEPLEGRALMAGARRPEASRSGSAGARRTGVSASPALERAIEELFVDLGGILRSGAPATADQRAALRADLDAIAGLAGTPTQRPLAALTRDVAAAADAGAAGLGDAARAALVADSSAVLIAAGAPRPVADQAAAAARSALAVVPPTPGLTDPSASAAIAAVSTARAGLERGQGATDRAPIVAVTPSATTPAPAASSTTPFLSLPGRLSTIYARSTAIPRGQRAALRNDLVAVAASGTRAPSASLVAALDATTRAGGPLNEARKDALAAAFAAVVGGSGVAPSLAEQTGQDVRALLGGGLLPADLSALAPRRRPAEGPRRPDPDGADDPRLVVPGGSGHRLLGAEGG